MRDIAFFGYGSNLQQGCSVYEQGAPTGAGTTLSVPELALLRGRG